MTAAGPWTGVAACSRLCSRGNFIIFKHLPFRSTLNFTFVEFETACCVEFCSPAN